jgi:hypothetical protein
MIFIIALLFLLPIRAWAMEPQTVGLAGVSDLSLKNAAALAWNPATLGPYRGFRMSFEIPSVGMAIANNAFSVSYWNNHIAGDRYFSDAAKNDILDKIPDGGLQANAHVTTPLIGFTYDNFALRIATRSASETTLPREMAELALKGNQLYRKYNFGNLTGGSLNLLDAGLGFSYRFEQDRIPDLHFGIGFHYYQGLYLATLADADGNLTVTDETITGSSNIHAVTSNQGDGVGFDLGSYAVLSKQWEVGLSFRQLGSRIAWQLDDNDRISFYTDSAGLIIDSLDDDEYIERGSHYSDTSYTGGAFETPLPVIVQMNARYLPYENWSVMGDVQIITRETLFGKGGIQAGVASEYRVRRFLPLYGGVSVGGPWKVQIGIGGGLRFRHYELDLGWNWIGGMFNGSRGIGFGLSQRLNF